MGRASVGRDKVTEANHEPVCGRAYEGPTSLYGLHKTVVEGYTSEKTSEAVRAKILCVELKQ